MKNKPEVSIIMPNWNGMPILSLCLKNIEKHCDDLDYGIITIDNASQDESCKIIEEKFPKVKLIRNRGNYYFAVPTNLGARRSKGGFLFLLNNDVLLHENCLQILIKSMRQNQEIGAIAAQLTGIDGTIQPSCRAFPTFKNLITAGLNLDTIFDYPAKSRSRSKAIT